MYFPCDSWMRHHFYLLYNRISVTQSRYRNLGFYWTSFFTKFSINIWHFRPRRWPSVQSVHWLSGSGVWSPHLSSRPFSLNTSHFDAASQKGYKQEKIEEVACEWFLSTSSSKWMKKENEKLITSLQKVLLPFNSGSSKLVNLAYCETFYRTF